VLLIEKRPREGTFLKMVEKKGKGPLLTNPGNPWIIPKGKSFFPGSMYQLMYQFWLNNPVVVELPHSPALRRQRS